jgi:hypothetical protein
MTSTQARMTARAARPAIGQRRRTRLCLMRCHRRPAMRSSWRCAAWSGRSAYLAAQVTFARRIRVGRLTNRPARARGASVVLRHPE